MYNIKVGQGLLSIAIVNRIMFSLNFVARCVHLCQQHSIVYVRFGTKFSKAQTSNKISRLGELSFDYYTLETFVRVKSRSFGLAFEV